MIFAPESIDASKAGRKTNTRRPRQPGETCDRDEHGNIVRVRTAKGRIKWEVGRTYAMNPPPPKGSKARMGKQVGRFLLRGIRCEQVGSITDDDAEAEGAIRTSWLRSGPWTCEEEAWHLYGKILSMDPDAEPWAIRFKGKVFYGQTPREAFLQGWRFLYPKSDLTEMCWVLNYETVQP